jgi:hypothetical protein
MPRLVHQFSSSLFGKFLILLSILSISYYNIVYGIVYSIVYSIVLAVLFVIISEIGYFEGFESKIMSNMKGNWNRNKRKARMLKDGFTNKVNTTAERFARKHGL